MRILILSRPSVSPFRFAREFVIVLAGFCHRLSAQAALRRTQRELNMPTMLLRMTHNACARRRERVTPSYNIGVFFVLVSQRTAFQLPMLRGALDPRRKMAPITGRVHGAGTLVRTRR